MFNRHILNIFCYQLYSDSGDEFSDFARREWSYEQRVTLFTANNIISNYSSLLFITCRRWFTARNKPTIFIIITCQWWFVIVIYTISIISVLPILFTSIILQPTNRKKNNINTALNEVTARGWVQTADKWEDSGGSVWTTFTNYRPMALIHSPGNKVL